MANKAIEGLKRPMGAWDSPITQAFSATSQAPQGLALNPVLTPEEVAANARAQASLAYGSPGADIAIQSQLLAAQGNHPAWQTGVSNPNNIASSAGEGFSNAVQNFLAERHYGQNRKELQQLGQQYAMGQQNQVQMAQNLAAQTLQHQQDALALQNQHDQGVYTQLSALDPNLAQTYMNSDRAGRDHILQTASNAGLTQAFSTPLAVAQENATQAANTARIQSAASGPPVANAQGVTNPAGFDQYRIRTGITPTTPAQVAQEQYQLQGQQQGLEGQRIQNASAKLDLQAKPQMLQSQLANASLQVTAQEINNNKAAVEAQFTQAHNQLALDTGNLNNKAQAATINKINNGWNVYQQLEASGRLDSQDPTVQAENAALLGAHGIPWKAPANTKVQVIKTKNGKTLLFNSETNQYAQVSGNGSVGEWSALGASD